MLILHTVYHFYSNLDVLQEPAKATQSFSSAHHPTLSQTIPTLEYMHKVWLAMAEEARFSPLSNAVYKGIEAIDKWYNKVDDTNAHFIALSWYLIL